MFPTIMANESIIVAPIDPETVRLRDIILYRTNSQLIAHRVVSIEKMLEVSLTTPRSSGFDPSRLPFKGESPLVKRSARQAQRSSNEVLHHRSAPSSAALLQAQRSSSEALHFFLRGDASDTCDLPVTPAQILGKVIAIERFGHRIDPYSSLHRLSSLGLAWLARSKRLLRTVFSIFATDGR